MAENIGTVKQRDFWFDNAKGVLMITVVVGHLIASVVNKYETFAFLSNLIYFFHMPAFAIISGYFMKRRIDTKDYASVINKTLLPYCFAQIIIYLAALILPDGVRVLSAERLADSGVFSFLFPIYHLWYFFGVMAAFVFCIAFKAKEHPARAFVVSVIISLISGAVPTVEFLKLTKVLAFLPFFVLGYLIPREKMQRVRERKFIIPSLIVAAATIVGFWLLKDVGTLTGIFAMTWRYQSFAFDISYLGAILVRLGFIVCSVIFSLAFLNLCPKKKSIFTVLGKRSVYIYILHVLIVAVIRHLNYEYGIFKALDSPITKIIYLIFGVVICYVLVSKPVVKLFEKLFEPKFDIRKISEYLGINKI